MNTDVPLVEAGCDAFVDIPTSVKLAILLPTARWTPMARSVIGSLAGTASEEVAVLVADNSENPDKRAFLEQIRGINPYVFAVAHRKNIGASGNFFYLHDWCKNVEFSAMMADDDWMSPGYHDDAYRTLLANPSASGAAAGTTLADFGDGKPADVGQPSMRGATPIARISQWDGLAARVTMYNASRRAALDAAVRYYRETPLNGLTLVEDLWELSRLAQGDFLNATGSGCFLHYPATGSHLGNGTQRFYDLLCKEAGLQYPFVYFTALSTAIQCAVFLMGAASPIADPEQRVLCGQHVFRQLFCKGFLPKFSGASSHEAVTVLFAQHPEAMAGYLTYCKPPFSQNPVFDAGLLAWFIEIIKALETRPEGDQLPLSTRFLQFVESELS